MTTAAGNIVIPQYVGPYENWLYGQGRPYAFPAMRHYRPGDSVTVVAELTPPESVREIEDVAGQTPRGEVDFLIPTLWSGDGDFKAGYLPLAIPPKLCSGGMQDVRELSDALAQLSECGCVARSRLGRGIQSRYRLNFPLQRETIRGDFDRTECPRPVAVDEDTVAAIRRGEQLAIIAFIEDGIPFAHRNFRNRNGGTRIDYCWLQSASGPSTQEKSSVLFGTEYTNKDIDGLVADYEDEDALYAAAGAADALPELGVSLDRRGSHGSVVMDIAAGFGPGSDVPPDNVRIIAVQLPNTVAWDTSGFGKDMYLLAAFHYIFDRADRIAEAYYGRERDSGKLEKVVPLVVNFSYGFSGGPHDANSDAGGGLELENAIDEMVVARREKAPTVVVMASGNTFAERLHAVIDASRFQQANESAVLYWRVQPDDRTPSYLEIWFPDGTDSGDYEVSVLAPGVDLRTFAIKADPSTAGDPVSLFPFPDEQQQFGQASADRFRDSRWRFLLAVAPTEPETTFVDGEPIDIAAASAGKWEITVTRKAGRPPEKPLLCWIQRDDDPFQFRSGSRQSYFDMPGSRSYSDDGTSTDDDAADADPFVHRFGTLNGLATGRTILPVAGYSGTARNGYRPESGRASDYSSAGHLPSRQYFDKQIGAAGLTDPGPATPGIVAAGTRSGALSRVIGTSTAAPQVARQLADAFAAGDAPCGQVPDNYASLLSGTSVNDTTSFGTAHPTTRLGDKFVTTRHKFRG